MTAPVIRGELGNRFIVAADAADMEVGYFGLYTTNAAVSFRYAVIYDHDD